jgi:hypothetical protein
MEDEQQPFTNNSRRIATPILGFPSDTCRAAPIPLRAIGAASFLPVYLCVSRTQALLMASNTSYLNDYWDASAFMLYSCVAIYKRLAILVPDLGCKGSTLLSFQLADPICYG